MITNKENGRSMIEMLGVLAIIGVLSVGGIAGYSKAMMKYRVNKTIEQITLITGNVRTFFKGDYMDLDSYTNTGRKILKKAKLVPDEMWNNVDNEIYAECGKINLYASSTLGDKFFYLSITDLSDDECIELATQDWRANSGSSLYQMSVNGDCPECDLGMSPCVSEDRVVCAKDMPMSIDEAVEACSYFSPTSYIFLIFQ